MKKTLLAFLIIITLAFTVINAIGESGDPFAAGISLFNSADYVAATQELAKAVEREKYEEAARLRDQLIRLKGEEVTTRPPTS